MLTIVLEAAQKVWDEGLKLSTLFACIVMWRKHVSSNKQRKLLQKIAEAVGCADVKVSTNSTVKTLLMPLHMEKFTAGNARFYTHLAAMNQLTEVKKMKKLLSRKFLLAVSTAILVALNDALNWGLDQGTITSVCSVVVGWIVAEAGTDIVKLKNGNGFDESKSH